MTRCGAASAAHAGRDLGDVGKLLHRPDRGKRRRACQHLGCYLRDVADADRIDPRHHLLKRQRPAMHQNMAGDLAGPGQRAFQRHQKPGAKLDVGFVGEVIEVNTAPLRECIAKGITPVISPTARGEDGKVYNCNADVAAAQAAIALKAKRLVFMSDVPGLLSDPQDPDSVIAHLKTVAVAELKRTGVIDKGMIPKVDSAVAAIQSGVEKVSFVDGRVPHAVLLEIFTDEGVGTEVVR